MVASSPDRWEHFPHVADCGVRGYGATKAAAFEQAALAMLALMVDPATVAPAKTITIHCEAPDDELLLVDWLNALLYEMATRQVLFSTVQVEFKEHELQGTAWGETIALQKHSLGVEVKGATYTELSVHQLPDGGWLAQCIVDV
ncbi:MAG: archease [Candidatus Competibacteraceae bacterium]